MIVQLNKSDYQVNSDEFKLIDHKEYCNLSIRDDLGKLERLNSLLIEISEIGFDNIIFLNPTHGGFMPINVSKYYKNIYLSNVSNNHKENIIENIKNQQINNISYNLNNIEEK
jgi:hypothetical protein